MVLALRLVGWGLFLIGMGLFIWSGGFSSVQDLSATKRTMAWAGIIGAMTGMLSTSFSRLLSHFAQQRRLKEKIRERTQLQWKGELKPVEPRTSDPPAKDSQ